ncbi:hypothetical protein MUP01_05640, partial [Candidatus Bathyarchaeota archaeon]|nr:hypothetical protein [Candidatus Bathyarchaeota archaeon]
GYHFAPAMRFAGIDHLFIKGRSNEPKFLWIDDEKIEIKNASSFWGMNTIETQEAIKSDLGDSEIQSLVIGIAGERMVKFANIRTGMKSSAGKGGGGCVMGSKNLKAIAVRGSSDLSFSRPDELVNYCKELSDKFMETKWAKALSKWGTMAQYSAISTSGYLRNKNLQNNKMENAESIDVRNIIKYQTGKTSCYGCTVGCRHRYHLDGSSLIGEGPEFSTQLYLGHLLDCADFEYLLKVNDLTNLLGIDQMEIGSIIAGTIDLLENGLISKNSLDNLNLGWGETGAILKIIDMIAKREGFGNILAEGIKGIIKEIGKDSERYFPNIKGMGTLATDDRYTPSFALGIATSTRGADHLRSRPAIDTYGLPEEVLSGIYGCSVSSNRRSLEGKSRMIWLHELLYSIVDSLGLCKLQTVFISVNAPKFEEYSKLIELATDIIIPRDDLMQIGERICTLERLFNNREGFTRKDDNLPRVYYEGKILKGYPHKENMITEEEFGKLLDQYYELHGWDNKGIPKENTLEMLGLNKEPTHIL